LVKDDLVPLLPDLRAFARFLHREREGADDLVQNTVMTAMAKHHQFEQGTNLKAWLFTIMRTQFYSSLRSAKRRETSPLDDGAIDTVASTDTADRGVELSELSRALWRLNPQYREALVLVGASGFSYEEAAAMCGCSVGTMKARVSRARKQISESMQ
jgi:RNA polymerase sigma-70 factor (ECF subfamily)